MILTSRVRIARDEAKEASKIANAALKPKRVYKKSKSSQISEEAPSSSSSRSSSSSSSSSSTNTGMKKNKIPKLTFSISRTIPDDK